MLFKFRRRSSSSSEPSSLGVELGLADGFRDTGAFAEAARHYEAALAAAPTRTDIKVQLANMLKDSGDFVGAESSYLAALADDPGNADTHLQLGHLWKVSGRRGAALDSYSRALELDPLLAVARLELAAAGETGAQVANFEHQMRHGGVDALLTIRSRLDEIARQIAEIRASLPDSQASVAFPVEIYGEMRRLFDCPPPMSAPTNLSIVIILLADREPLESLYAQISAISEQAHGLWTLRVVGLDADRRVVAERAAARDGRIQWIDAAPDDDLAAEEFRIAIEAQTDWVLLLARGARLHCQALAWIAAAAARTDVEAIILDEEVGEIDDVSDDLRSLPRQIVDRDSILEANIYGENIAVTSRTLNRLGAVDRAPDTPVARALLLLGLIGTYRVAHIPLPLIRVPAREPIEPGVRARDHAAAVRAHFGNRQPVAISPAPWSGDTLRILRAPGDGQAKIAVIIPTKNNSQDVLDFVESLIALAKYPETLEILILNNGLGWRTDPLLTALAGKTGVAIMDIAEPFNWSRFNNLGAENTQAPNLIFANDDMVMLTPDWDEIVRSFLEREDVGALGARLLYRDDTVQHAGILFNWRGSVIHDGLYRPASEAGPSLRWHVTRSVSAVTGAFLATRRANFELAKGFDEIHLAVSYSDIDYALKQRSLGFRIIWSPMLTLHHFESKTRGLDHLSTAKAARNSAERRILETRWPGAMRIEPSLNPIWQQASLPHRLMAFPSQDHVWSYIERGAAENPWIVGPPRA